MLEKKIFSSNLKARCHRNISREVQKALENLRTYDDIIIKQADKGSAVVILDRDKYVLFCQLLHGSARVMCERDTKSHARHIPFSVPAHAQRLTKDSHNTGNFMPCSFRIVCGFVNVPQ